MDDQLLMTILGESMHVVLKTGRNIGLVMHPDARIVRSANHFIDEVADHCSRFVLGNRGFQILEDIHGYRALNLSPAVAMD